MQVQRADYEEDIQECMRVFRQHGIILYPTDRRWGIGCSALDDEAIDRVLKLKEGAVEKRFTLLMTDVRQLSKYIASPLPDLESRLKEFSLPNTIIYDQAINLPQDLIAQDGSIAIRIVSDPFCRSLIKRMKSPLVETSANLIGDESPTTFYQIDDKVLQGVDYMVRWRREESISNTISTLYKLNKDGSFSKLP